MIEYRASIRTGFFVLIKQIYLPLSYYNLLTYHVTNLVPQCVPCVIRKPYIRFLCITRVTSLYGRSTGISAPQYNSHRTKHLAPRPLCTKLIIKITYLNSCQRMFVYNQLQLTNKSRCGVNASPSNFTEIVLASIYFTSTRFFFMFLNLIPLVNKYRFRCCNIILK